MSIFCSTIIPTIGRESLSAAVNSVLEQEFHDAGFEVIVANDSGSPLPDAAWQRDQRVQVVSTNRSERSVARNAGVSVASGKYLHFLDDDDLLLPGALRAFWRLDQRAGNAVWLYGSYQTVDNEGGLVEIIRPGLSGNIFAWTIAGESIPFQASLLLAGHFRAVGEFDSQPAIIGVEDRDVGRRMALGGQVLGTSEIVAQIRIGQQMSTTNWSTIAESDRLGREKALRLAGAADQLFRLSDTPELRNRVSRAYIASAAWNLRRGDSSLAASRVKMAIRIGGLNLLTPRFWIALGSRAR